MFKYAKERRILVSHNQPFICVNFIIRLTTCFGLFARPSSRHKIYNGEKLYSLSHKIQSKFQQDLIVL